MSIPQIKKKNDPQLPNKLNGYYITYLMKNNKYYCYKCATKDWDNKVMFKYLMIQLDINTRCECCDELLIPDDRQ